MLSSNRFRRCAFGAALLLLSALPAGALAHEGHDETVQYIRSKAPLELDVGAPQSADAVLQILGLAADIAAQEGQPLIPPGTMLDRVSWEGNVLHLDLTIADVIAADGTKSRWRINEIDAETISRALAGPFLCDPASGGVLLRVRGETEPDYGPLTRFMPAPERLPEPVGPIDADELPVPLPQPPPGQGIAGGPVTSAARQPAGALSGVTVYCAAGHGWTAGSSAWFLQRPVLLGMCEDYGNIDQLNYFAAYAFNAGATVVPLRPVGWQPLEIVLDQDDPGVTYTGAWSDSGGTKYYENGVTSSGVPYRFISTTPAQTATARFTPAIAESDFYPVYCFAVASSNRAPQVYRIAHGGGLSEVTVDHRNVGNGWVWLGTYYLPAGSANYVEISNQSPVSGVVIADAIRFGGGYGDVARPGPGGVSGYPREEEGQRYWAHGEQGQNAVGFDAGIWDGGSDDLSDNVGAGARLAAEMNAIPAGGVQVDRWKRIYLEFHTNALNGAARGQLTLITDLGATTNQVSFAQILSDEVDADLLLVDDSFEHLWTDRSSSTLTGSYGAIATTNNDNEFDATLVELAFHDNSTDAELLRDPRVRSAMGRACVHGIIRFLNGLPGSQVPLAFPPDTPRSPRVIDQGGGNVLLAWDAPLVDGARGQAATGYVIYQSSDGFGFGSPVVLGNVTSHVLSGVAVSQTRYFRIAATNAGGESMPTEVLAVRRPASGTADILIVNGFDRLRRQTNSRQTFTQPPAYAGLSIERQIWRSSNAFDYIVEHAEALAANGYGFSSCANEAIIGLNVALGSFDNVVWILGNESSADQTLNGSEQSALTAFLSNAHGLFISGADLSYDLVNLAAGTTFANSKLKIGYAADSADTYSAAPTAGGIFNGLPALDFSPAAGARLDVPAADVLTLQSGALAALNYSGGIGGVAAVQYTGPSFNTVTFGFPFEALGSAGQRAQVIQRVISFLRNAAAALPFDNNNDGDVDWSDAQVTFFCLRGPGFTYPSGNLCRTKHDANGDADVDLGDIAALQRGFTGPNPP